MSIRLQIRDAVIAALNVTTRPADVPEATKRRWTPGSNDPSYAVIFIDDPVDPNQRTGFAVTRKHLTIGVECVQSADLPELSDDIVEPMLSWAEAALVNTNMDGLAHEIEYVTTKWEQGQADKVYMRATVLYSISYQTKRGDLTLKQ